MSKKQPVQKPQIENINVSRTIKGLTMISQVVEIDDFNLNYCLSKNISHLNSVERAYNKSVIGLQHKHVKKLDNGNFAIENGYFVFNSAKAKEAFDSAKQKLDETIADVELWFIKTSVLKTIKGEDGNPIKGLAYMMTLCNEMIIDDDDSEIK